MDECMNGTAFKGNEGMMVMIETFVEWLSQP